ncbi:XRE family transcriptional regulator [Stenotrophomonas sp. ISL-67]|nr:XRE family transcriptional regulator [Stenotrophomonas sp. ISL-67]MBT2767621.1 XRE family transcriptional regulator [Stenotrophomonas sp. ISL-67]
MAVACGLSKRSQIHFEQDEHLPGGAYLVEAEKLGVDMGYLIGGRRERVSEADAELLEMWRDATPHARIAAMNALIGNAQDAGGASRTSFSNATIGQQLSGDVDLRAQKIVVKPPKATKKPAL